MRHKLLAVSLLAIVLLLPASQAAAQSDICFEVDLGQGSPSLGCYLWDDFDYTLPSFDDDGGYAELCGGITDAGFASSGVITPGIDKTCDFIGPVDTQQFTVVRVNFPLGCQVTSISVEHRATGFVGAQYGEGIAIGDGGTYTKLWNDGNGSSDWQISSDAWFDYGFNWENAEGFIFVETSEEASTTEIRNVTFACENGSVEPPGGIGDGLVQPIKEADQIDVFHGLSESGLIISDSSIIATDASNIIPDAAKAPYVYSSITGTVDEIIPYLDGTFVVTVTGMVDGEEHEVTYSNLTDINVLTGDEITMGCVIGKAGPQIRHYESNEALFEIHYSIVNLDVPSTIPGLANYQNWTLYASPTGNTPCGDNFSGTCLNQNPAFDRDGQYWYGIDNVSGDGPNFGEGGAILPAGSAIAQDIEIPELSTYTITIGAVATTDLAVAVTVRLGDDEDADNTFVDGAMQVIQTSTLTPTTPDIAPDLYTLTIEANRPLKIVYVCLQDEADASPTPPSTCLLQDYSFVTGDGWTFTDGAEIVETPGLLGLGSTSELRIPELGDATQTIALDGYDDRDAVYDVSVKVNLPWGWNSADGATLSVGYDATDPDYNQSSSFDVKPNLLVQTFRDQWTIPEGITTTGDFVLNVPSLTGDTTYLSVMEVCIAPRDGYWPNQPEIPPSESELLCIQTVEFVVENPTGIEQVGKWIVSALQWVGRFLDISIECNIARLRETVMRLLDPVLAWFRMIGKWLFFSIDRFTTWVMNILGYLTALLRNVFNSIFNAIWAALIETAIFQGAYDNLDLVSTIIDTLIALVMQIIGMVIRAINILGTLAQVIAIFWASLVTAFNDPTATNTGMPTCSSILESDPGYLMCIGLDLFDYVVLSFPAMNVLGAVGIAAIALYTIKKLSERIGDVFGGTG